VEESRVNKVETYANWGHWDRLDGSNLKDGERVCVQWPDGSHTEETIRLIKGKVPIQDHGHVSDYDDHRAQIVVLYRGAAVPVPLRKSDLLLERL
jgi:hypothetical protein